MPVNLNSLAQTVVAGEADAVKKAADIFAQNGIRTVMLSSPCAFHSPMMRPAAEKFAAALAGFEFTTARIPFYSNLDGRERAAINTDYLMRHMMSPVRFTDQLANMQAAGIGRFIEIGPAKVVSGLIKRTLKDVEIYNIEDLKSLDKTLSAIS